jgi:hypothetical protein
MFDLKNDPDPEYVPVFGLTDPQIRTQKNYGSGTEQGNKATTVTDLFVEIQEK